MLQQVEYGAGNQLQFDTPDSMAVEALAGPSWPMGDDFDRAVEAAIRRTLNCPPLDQWTTPGDSVALAVGGRLVLPERVVASVICELLRAGVEPERITVVHPRGELSLPERLVPDDVRRVVRQVRHDPRDQDQLFFLGAGVDDQPIYLNRELCEADLVIPLGSITHSGEQFAGCVAEQLFPTFSDALTQRRYHRTAAAGNAQQRQRRRDEAVQAVRQLGAEFTVQIVPAGANRALRIFAGLVNDVEREGGTLFREAWSRQFAQPADLVVVGLTPVAAEVMWSDLEAAIRAADGLVTDGGTIVLCTDWSRPPGLALQALAAADSPQQFLEGLRRQRSSDAATARALAEVLQRARIVWLSRLPASDVEALGIGALSDARELTHLARHHRHCTLVHHAQLILLEQSASVGRPVESS